MYSNYHICESNVLCFLIFRIISSLDFDAKACSYCGKCVKSCPSDIWIGKNGYVLSFGGMFGNEILPGIRLLPILFEKEQVFRAADAAIRFYEAHGKAGERFGRTIAGGTALLQEYLDEALRRPAGLTSAPR